MDKEPSGILVAEIEAPLITGAIENVFAPENVCVPVNKATFVDKAVSAIEALGNDTVPDTDIFVVDKVPVFVNPFV